MENEGIRQKWSAPVSEVNEPAKTIMRPDIALRIKENVKRVWKRVKGNKGLKQENLAKALDVHQSAISKLINDVNGHPWTETHLRRFAQFCQVSPKELLHNDQDLLDFFDGWSEEKSAFDQNLVEECIQGLTLYYSDKGIAANREKLTGLAARLATRLDGTSPDAETMNSEIEKVILENAMAS